MYTAFYSLKKKPFSMTPDPAFLYMTSQHREALTGLTYSILDRKGFLVLSGMAGAGKTTLLAWVLQNLPTDKVQVSVILNPTLTTEEFLEMALLDFGIEDVPPSKAKKLWILQKFLLASREQGKVSVLIVDEAHKLSYELLEEIRLLGNIEYMDEKLLQILLLGQRELDDVLNRPDLCQLKQRIGVRLSLQALSSGEVEAYIQHRWTVAGGATHPFTPEAIAVLKKGSAGIPRLINSICDNALTQAFADGGRTVEARHVELAMEDLRLNDRPYVAAAPIPMVAPAPRATITPIVQAPRVVVPESPDATLAAAAGAAVDHKPLPIPITTPLNGHKPESVLKGFDAFSRKRGFWSRWAERLGLSSEIN